MPATQDLSIITLVIHASFIAKCILIILLIASIASWTHIFQKYFQLKDVQKQTHRFEKAFWAGHQLSTLYQSALQNTRANGSLQRIFIAGMQEYSKNKEHSAIRINTTIDNVRRAMIACYQRELDQLEEGTSFLATVGSVSPYIGLLGTVWGIMNAFQGLAYVQQATLANVAPGIAEALIATAVGLFAAIPAVIAYNRFTHQIDRLAIHFETFIDEFTNILQRQPLKEQ